MPKRKICHRFAASQAATPSVIVSPYSLADQRTTFLPEDIIVAEILLRLSVKPLFIFKTVSKRYQSIISDPKFARNYLQRAYSSPESSSSLGLAVVLLFPFTSWSRYKNPFSNNVKDLIGIIDSNTIYHGDQHDLSIHVSLVSLSNGESHVILASSNGLTLSYVCYGPYAGEWVAGSSAFYVSNPLTKQCVPLPEPAAFTTPYDFVFGFATRLIGDRDAAFLTYKIVLIRSLSYVAPGEYENTTVNIFSSDTGSWAASDLRCCTGEVFELKARKSGFARKGILHWLGTQTMTIITYDPYDNPDRFGLIGLPSTANYYSSCYKSLIYSGDEEMLKYCEIDRLGLDRLSVWKLVDSNKGEWCLEGEFRVPSLRYDHMRLMAAPSPWNREVICYPYVIDNKVMVINPRTGRRRFVNVFEESAQYPFNNTRSARRYPLVPIELSPWSSPLYAQV